MTVQERSELTEEQVLQNKIEQFKKEFIDCSSYTDTLKAMLKHAEESFKYYEQASEEERRDDAQLALIRLINQLKVSISKAESLENIIFDSH